MYQSPIDMIFTSMKAKVEKEVFVAIQEVGIDVKRDELLKALEYDRGQYEKGFADGLKVNPMRPKGEWIEGKCVLCGTHAPYWQLASTYYESDFCPGCGADMRRKQDDK